METRKVVIINNKSQKQSIIAESKATTLGELKAEMRALGIEYTGMTFYEGHMRAELKDDASPLPTNIPYKGQVVNDLTFLLTAPEKKIRSGAMTRNELIAEAKRLGFPSNPTQAKSAVLQEFIEKNGKKAPVLGGGTQAKKAGRPRKAATPDTTTAAPTTEAPQAVTAEVNVEKGLLVLLEALVEDDVISDCAADAVREAMNSKADSTTAVKAEDKLSSSEIAEMFSFVD